ncbi:MAG: hypothetical protein LC804_13910, partial [Acidobacteria bacterium]|nr:hypothetical protein [Acidobacteriota bacterium]
MRTGCPRPGFALPRSIAGLSIALGSLCFSLAVSAQATHRPPAQTAEPARPSTGSTTADPALPSARSIIDRHVQAIGGKAAVQSHSSTRATGTFSVASAGMTGAIEVFAAKPDKSIVKITIPGVGEIVEGYDGKDGWTVSAMTGPMLLEGKQLEEKRFDTEFYGELHDDSRYQSMTTMERTDFEGRPCYKIRLVRKSGGEDFEFYDVNTGLKAGRIATRE